MKTILPLLFLAIISFDSFSQDRYVIQFTDKNNSPYSVSNPSAFLTARSIARRTKQNIAITTNDLPVNPAYIQGVINTGATLLNVSKWLNTATIQTSSPAVLAAIAALPYVQSSNNVGRLMHKNENTSPSKFNDEVVFSTATPALVASKTASVLNYGTSFHQINMCNGDYLHNNNFTGEGMMIAVIDAGFFNADLMTCFDSLRSVNKILATYDFVDHNTSVYEDYPHGAECFSIMGANAPGVIIGSAPHASYILLRSEDANTEYIIEEYNWASAAEYADSMGADVFSTSLGYTLFQDSTQDHTYATLDGNTAPMTIAADLAVSKGIVVINSAGNEGNSPWNYISVPSDANDILAVGAVDSLEFYVGFSGNGPSFDGRVKPDLAAQGSGTYFSNPWDNTASSGGGTSFSGPVIAGLTACLWQANPNLTAVQIMQAVRQSASQFTNPDTLLGYGIPDFLAANLILSNYEINNSIPSLSIFPNPVKEIIQFAYNSTDKFSVEVLDVCGRIVFEKSFIPSGEIYSIPFSDKKGFYFLRINSEEKTITKPFVSQ